MQYDEMHEDFTPDPEKQEWFREECYFCGEEILEDGESFEGSHAHSRCLEVNPDEPNIFVEHKL